MQASAFNKRIYTPSSFVTDVYDLFRHRDDLRLAVRRRRVDRAFAEKLMLVVTEVNRCRYCSFVHTWAALRAGVTERELEELRAHEFVGLPPREAAALQFARHYAEQAGLYDRAAWEGIVDLWGVDAAREILTYLRAISFGNLLGNTFDALLSRLRDRPASRSSFVAEAAVLLLAATGVPTGIALWALLRFVTHVRKGVLAHYRGSHDCQAC